MGEGQRSAPRLRDMAGAGALGGLVIGLAEWSLGDTRGAPATAAWIVACFTVASALTACLAGLAAARIPHRPRLEPLWLWAWFWAGLYMLLFANIGLLPRQSFRTAPSIALSVAALLVTGLATRLLTAPTRRLRALEHADVTVDLFPAAAEQNHLLFDGRFLPNLACGNETDLGLGRGEREPLFGLELDHAGDFFRRQQRQPDVLHEQLRRGEAAHHLPPLERIVDH